MGILGGLKAVIAGAKGKKLIPEFPENLDTSSIDDALSIAFNIADERIKNDCRPGTKLDVFFSLSETFKGNPVLMKVSFEIVEGMEERDESVTLYLSMNQKECDQFIKQYKANRNLSVFMMIPFCVENTSEWFFNTKENLLLTDMLSMLGVDTSSRWNKDRVEVTSVSVE